MSSIQPINVLDKQEFAKMNKNEVTINPYVSYLNDVNYDSFAPSFKGGREGVAKPLIGAAGEKGHGFMADISKNLKGKLMRALAVLMMAGGVAMGTTSCNKPLVDIDITINQDYSALYELLAQQMEQNNQNHEDMLELQRLMREVLLRLIANGETLEEIDQHVVENGYHLEDLVAGQEELVELVKKLVAGMAHLEELGEGGNALGLQILQAILTMNADQNANYDDLVAWLNDILINKLDDMSEQEAAHHAAIIDAMMQMGEELQGTLLQILQWVSTLPEVIQNGYFALLAQLQGMSLQLGAGLIQLIAHIDQWGETFQSQFNTLIQNFNNFSAQVQAGIAAILARLDAVLHNQEAQQAQILQLINNVNNWGEAFMNQLNTLLAHFDQFSEEMQAGIMLLMAQLQTMQEAQAQQVLNIINHMDQIGEVLQTLLENFNQYSAQVQAGIAQILAKIDGLTLEVQQLVVSAINIIGNQQAIIALMQQMRAEALAAYAEIIAHMGTIEQNQQANAEWLARIFVQLQNNGIQLSEINQFLQSVNFGPDVNLDVVIALLQQIIAQNEQHPNELLNNNNQNTQLIVNAINLVKAKLNAMQNDFNTNFSPAHFDYLERILNAIQGIDIQTCNCDCELIIQLITQIANDIHDGINHEGYEEEDPYAELGLDP